MMNMSYACDDIEKTYEELNKRGVEFEGPPQKQPWGTYAMFKDSEGNRFVFRPRACNALWPCETSRAVAASLCRGASGIAWQAGTATERRGYNTAQG